MEVAAAAFVEDVHLCASVLLNCVLLYAIRRFTRKSLGAYKQLLTIFAAFDIFLTILHILIKPRVIIVGTIFGVTGIYEDREITAFYTSCFTVPFALMNIHFLYRYWAIRRPHLIALFSTKKFITLLAFYPFAELVIWYLISYFVLTGEGPEVGKSIVTAEYGRKFGRNSKELKEGWLMMHHWENDRLNMPIFAGMISFDMIMIVSFSLATTLGALTFYHIKKAEKFSSHAHTLQWKLFIAVCAQTFVPLVFVYIPYFCVLHFPFFRLSVGIIDDACVLLTACFPAWDAVIIIMLMKDYRDGLIGIILQRKTVPIGTTVFTTSVVPSVVPSVH